MGRTIRNPSTKMIKRMNTAAMITYLIHLLLPRRLTRLFARSHASGVVGTCQKWDAAEDGARASAALLRGQDAEQHQGSAQPLHTRHRDAQQ